MADARKPYIQNVNGIDHTVLLDPQDVERYGDSVRPASSGPAKSRRAPRNKAATPENAGATPPAS